MICDGASAASSCNHAALVEGWQALAGPSAVLVWVPHVQCGFGKLTYPAALSSISRPENLATRSSLNPHVAHMICT